MTIPAPAGVLLSAIREIETGRKDATAYNTLFGHNDRKLSRPITALTVDEVIASGSSWTREFGSSAAGAYQFMKATLQGLKTSERLTGREPFTPELQDQLGYALLKRRGYANWLSGSLSDVTFALNLAKEWASFPVLRDTKGAHRSVKRGQSYYAGDGLNKALVRPERIEALLAQAKSASPAAPSPQPSTPAPRKTLADYFSEWAASMATRVAVNTINSTVQDKPKMQTLITALLRHLLTTFGGGAATGGVLTDNEIAIVSGAIATLLGVLWSFAEKRLRGA